MGAASPLTESPLNFSGKQIQKGLKMTFLYKIWLNWTKKDI